jgi:putative hydrolase of the HAD superfamily
MAAFPNDLRIVFDLDDTLHSERDFAISGFRAAAVWAERNLGLSGLDGDLIAFLDQGHLGAVFELALRARKPSFAASELAGLRTAYHDHTPAIELYSDVAPVLAAIGTPLGLITDGRATMQRNKVRALGLEQRFAEIVYTDALGPGRQFFKPHKLAYELIAQRLGGAGLRFVYVGDNPAKDFVVPNAMGWSSIMIERPNRIHAAANAAPGGAPRAVIRSLSELAATLETLKA